MFKENGVGDGFYLNDIKYL